MKNIFKLQLVLLCISIIAMMYSCTYISPYPRYTLKTQTHIPDSLKPQYRTWITETVRAASQHMTGGDYEDADETIQQAEITAKRLFGVDVVGLRLELDEDWWHDINLLPNQLTPKGTRILDSLRRR